MKLKEQVCNLELSRKLKELGVSQKSYFHWIHWREGVGVGGWDVDHQENDPMSVDFSAFTVAELGEMLPRQIKLTHPRNNYWKIVYREPLQVREGEIRNDTYSVEANNEANARAKLLIYLIENKHIKVGG